MWPVVRERFIGYTEPLEGKTSFLYLDVLGLVTISYGCLVDPVTYAMRLPFVTSTGAFASRDLIAREWQAVKRCACGEYRDPRKCGWPGMKAPDDGRPCLAHRGHRAAEAITSIRLTDEGVRYVALAKLDEMATALGKRFPDFASWPADAQLATLSVAWACGAAFRFPKLDAALRAQDFATAAKECTIREAGNPGVIPRNKANRILYRNAAAVVQGVPQLDPSELYWPEVLPDVQPVAEPSEPDAIVHPDVPLGRTALDE
jgi:GH24 family phage-related lysozyme (muramidase)